MIMVPGDAIASRRSQLPRRLRLPRRGRPGATAEPLHEARDQFERDLILRTLAEQQGNMSRTADVLGVERSNLYRKMRAFGIAPSRRAEEERSGLSFSLVQFSVCSPGSDRPLNPSIWR